MDIVHRRHVEKCETEARAVSVCTLICLPEVPGGDGSLFHLDSSTPCIRLSGGRSRACHGLPHGRGCAQRRPQVTGWFRLSNQLQR